MSTAAQPHLASADPQTLLRHAMTVEGKREPNQVYGWIRDQVPIWRDSDTGLWYLFRWADCDAVLRSSNFGVSGMLEMDPRHRTSSSLRFVSETLSNLNAPGHTRIRSRIQKSFSVPVLKKSEAYVREVIEAAIDALRGRDSFDVVTDYAAQIPNTVICELLGVPRQDHHLFDKWLADQFRLLSPTPPSDTLLAETDRSTDELLAYIEALTEERMREPREDLISAFVSAQAEHDDPLSLREMVVTTTILLAGGSDTTKTAIAMGVRQLIETPEEYARLVADPSIDGKAFEEILRFGGAVLLANTRKAHADVEIAGERIAMGDIVVPVIAAANFDPVKFVNPQQFDVGRSPNPHLAFGGGIHVCVGNMLARMVGTIAVPRLIRAFPAMSLIGDGRDVNLNLFALRGLNSLPVQAGSVRP